MFGSSQPLFKNIHHDLGELPGVFVGPTFYLKNVKLISLSVANLLGRVPSSSL